MCDFCKWLLNVKRRQFCSVQMSFNNEKFVNFLSILLCNQTFWIFLLWESKWIFLVNLYLLNNKRGSRWFIKNFKSQSRFVVLLLRANFLLLVFQVPIWSNFFMKFIYESKKKVSRWFFEGSFVWEKLIKGNYIYLEEEKA